MQKVKLGWEKEKTYVFFLFFSKKNLMDFPSYVNDGYKKKSPLRNDISQFKICWDFSLQLLITQLCLDWHKNSQFLTVFLFALYSKLFISLY